MDRMRAIRKAAIKLVILLNLGFVSTVIARDIPVTLNREPVTGDSVKVTIFTVTDKGVGEPIGEILLEDTEKGLRFTPNIQGLPLGDHGFHVHENPSCEATIADNGDPIPAGAAGPHYDPEDTRTHSGPMGHGHLGDLPVLTAQGVTYRPVLAPHLKVADIHQRSLIIHQHSDNYTDSPAAGGSGPRIACGIVP